MTLKGGVILFGICLLVSNEYAQAGLVFGRINLDSTNESIDSMRIVCDSNNFTENVPLSSDGSYKFFLDDGNIANSCQLVVHLSGGDVVSAYIKSYADEEARYEFDIVRVELRHEMYRR